MRPPFSFRRCAARLPVLTVLLAMGLPACERAATPDSPDPADLPELEAVRELTIGREDDPDYALVPVGGLALLSSGEVLVAQGQLSEIRVFDREGRFVRRVGGEGQGPGEFRFLQLMGALGDTIWVIDPTNPRPIQLLAPDGRWIEGRTFPPTPSGFAPTTRVYPLPAGRLLMPAIPGSSARWTDHERPWLTFDAEGEPEATLPGVRQAAAFPVEFTGRLSDGTELSGEAAIRPVLREDSWVTPAPDHRSLLRAEYDWSDGDPAANIRFVRFTPDGDTLAASEVTLERPPVSDALADSLRANAIAGLNRALDDEGRATREVDAVLTVPARRPPIRDLRLGLDGTGWAALTGTEENRWLLLDEALEPVGIVRFPPSFTFEIAQGVEVWGVERDALDVPTVVRYRVLAPR